MKKIIYESNNVWGEEDKKKVRDWCKEINLNISNVTFNDDKTISTYTNKKHKFKIPPFPIYEFRYGNLEIINTKSLQHLPKKITNITFNNISSLNLPNGLEIESALEIKNCELKTISNLPIGDYYFNMQNSSIKDISKLSNNMITDICIKLFNNYNDDIKSNDYLSIMKLCENCNHDYVLSNINEKTKQNLFNLYSGKINNLPEFSEITKHEGMVESYVNVFITTNNYYNYNNLNNKSIIDIFIILFLINKNKQFNYFYNISKYIDDIKYDNSPLHILFQIYESEININDDDEILKLINDTKYEIKNKYFDIYRVLSDKYNDILNKILDK